MPHLTENARPMVTDGGVNDCLLEARHGVYLKKVKRRDGKQEEEEEQSRREDVSQVWAQNYSKEEKQDLHRLR